MKLREKLDWILDYKNRKGYSEEDRQINIAFVHSLGLKCDCVGWSELDLADPNADKILSAISSFCKERGWIARGNYYREYTDFESEWYELIPLAFKDDTPCGSEEYITDDENRTQILTIRAYREKKVSPKWFYRYIFVPERFRDACILHNVNDVVFCWAKDKGRYESEQYFQIFGNKQIATIATGCTRDIANRKRMNALGGYLPRLSEIFSELTIESQDCYIESDIPNCHIANAYASNGTNKFLLHKTFAELLLKEKAISKNDLRPALIVKKLPSGYNLEKTKVQIRPKEAELKRSILAYEKLKNTERPSQNISEKEALKTLRGSKRERKDDFKKALPKAIVPQVQTTKYAPVLPYYLISNGGYLSDEYELLSYNEALQENDLFFDEIRTEELIAEVPSGVVFAKCSDGDRVLLTDSGKVVRYSHEAPLETEEWISLAQFVVDAINAI